MWGRVLPYAIFVLLYVLVEGPDDGEGILCAPSTRINVEDVASRIFLRFYFGSHTDPSSASFAVNRAEGILNVININEGFVLYLHGFEQTPESMGVQIVLKAYLERQKENIIILDWGDLAFDDYITVLCRAKSIAKVSATMIDDLVQSGLDPSSLHIIGHSLGAQIAGFIGKYSENKIPRITGLDPALPGFYHPGAEHINSSDARFVDILHTDGGVYGVFQPTGTVDIYANGGIRPQPGCPLFGVPLSTEGFCSHHRSCLYYAESVTNEKAFLAVKCPNYAQYSTGRCRHNHRAYVGVRTPTDISGTYFFATNSEPPFSMGSTQHFRSLFRIHEECINN